MGNRIRTDMGYVITFSNCIITDSQGIHLPVMKNVDSGEKTAGLACTVK